MKFLGVMQITIGHTPDADDAFMFYAMTHGKIDMRGFTIHEFIEDIEKLNQRAFNCELDVTAISAHAYAFLQDCYRILSAGSSVGVRYGPIVVSKTFEDLEGKHIAIPGRYTTAFLLLKLALDEFSWVEMRFDRIMDAVVKGVVDAGLLIHEGQLTYRDMGLTCVLDLSEWWEEKTGLPLPLGLNAIKRSIPEKKAEEFLTLMKDSIKFALNNVDEALDYAMKYSRGTPRDLVKRFALMYVNEYTYEMPDSIKEALQQLFTMARDKDLVGNVTLDIL
jgi:1,4-dihydroxy-6-naphthoate synthase